MKQFFVFFLIICVTTHPMQQNTIVVMDGDNQSEQILSLGIPDDIVTVHTDGELSERYEYELLCGLLSLYQDLAYGQIDLRPLEQAIATHHGYPDLFRCDHEYRTDSDKVAQFTDSLAIMFVQSRDKIKNPFAMPSLASGQRLTIKTNLTDRIKIWRFLHSALNPSTVFSDEGARQRPVFLSHLEHAVLVELSDEDH